LKSTDVPIGISQRSKFPAAAFQLHIDDLLIAYTDGVTEVENRDREQYGLPRLERLLRSSNALPPNKSSNGFSKTSPPSPAASRSATT
jgi:serine phosphatase RsbU (regulator of sigma subunit)